MIELAANYKCHKNKKDHTLYHVEMAYVIFSRLNNQGRCLYESCKE